MPKFIFVLTIGVLGFAGYTLWQDPTTSYRIKSYLPSSGTVSVSSTKAAAPLGGVGAASRVTGAVAGAVKN